MKESSFIHIGTSGWHYRHWRGPFYPARLAVKDLFSFYVSRFATVEINNSFYGLPGEATLKKWYDAAPAGFIFSVKASRYITHMKKLAGTEQSVKVFFARVAILKEKLGPVLFQLPPRWGPDTQRFEAFLTTLPDCYRYVFEFRDTRWFREDIYAIMAKRGVGFCIYEFAGVISPPIVTGDLVYVRLHGPAGAYRGQYDEAALKSWSAFLRDCAARQQEAYCYFDNDEAGYAAADAARLRRMVSGDRPAVAVHERS